MNHPTKGELRKFGLTVGVAFILFGGVSWYRGHEIAPRILWVVGGLLFVPGAVAPALLRPVQRAWMRFAEVLGYVNTRIILTALFYLILAPVGLVMRLFRDPLSRNLDEAEDSTWVRRTPKPVDPASYEHQF